MPRNNGFLYPEYDHYGTHWKARITARLKQEKRYDAAREARLKYAKENRVDDEISWRWMCDAFPPLDAEANLQEELMPDDAPKEERKKKKSRGVDSYSKLSMAISMEEVEKLSAAELHKTIYWVVCNGQAIVKREDAPNSLAYNLLVMLRREMSTKGQRNGFRGYSLFMDFAKKMKLETDVKSEWLKDDQRLQGVLERFITNAEATRAAEMGSVPDSSS